MDQFVQTVGTHTGTDPGHTANCAASTVMGYYDGNATPALWNYAQHYAMSDNSFGDDVPCPSAPGAINLVAGTTGGVSPTLQVNNPASDLTSDGLGGQSLISDAQPYWDDCSTRDAVALTGKNIGDVLNAAGLSWGWFQGGFRADRDVRGGNGGNSAGRAASSPTSSRTRASRTRSRTPRTRACATPSRRSGSRSAPRR